MDFEYLRMLATARALMQLVNVLCDECAEPPLLFKISQCDVSSIRLRCPRRMITAVLPSADSKIAVGYVRVDIEHARGLRILRP